MRSTVLLGAPYSYTRVNGNKRCIKKYLLLKPKQRYITERSSMFAFNLQSLNDVCLQEFVSRFCEKAENAFSQPNPGIQEIAENLRVKHKTNVSFKLLCSTFPQLRELNPRSESKSEKHVSSKSCGFIYQDKWE